MVTPRRLKPRPLPLLFLLCCTALAAPAGAAATPEGCWTLQIGQFRDRDNAERRLAQSSGYLQCDIVAQDAGYAVHCGCFATASEARAAKSGASNWPDAFIRFRSDTSREANGGTSDSATIPSPVHSGTTQSSDLADESYPAIASSPPAERASIRVLRPDQSRPAHQFTTSLFGRPLTIGGEIELEHDRRRNFLLSSPADDLDRTEFSIELDFFYRSSDTSAVLIELFETSQHDYEPSNGDKETESELVRGETWYYTSGWFDDRVAYQLGRQNFVDAREWWWDANLDSVRVLYDTTDFHAEVALARELARTSTDQEFISPASDDVLRQIGWITWGLNERNRAELFWLYQDDRSATESPGSIIDRNRRDISDADLFWFGGRVAGRTSRGSLGRLHYWADLAGVRGKETRVNYTTLSPLQSQVSSVTRQTVSAWGADIGLIFETALPGKPSFYVGYATGTGDDDPSDGRDRTFRQTGLQGNEAKFRGVKRFHYYGELLDPELSNLQITTLGFGRRFWRRSSFDLVYHAYRQVHASDTLRDVRLRTSPTGLSDEIGEEWDFILAFRESVQWEFKIIAAQFTAGAAFGSLDQKRAREVVMEVTYNF